MVLGFFWMEKNILLGMVGFGGVCGFLYVGYRKGSVVGVFECLRLVFMLSFVLCVVIERRERKMFF